MSRTSDYLILPLILNRWSARAMSGQAITDTDLMTVFEAARWGQSSYNNQPWRFMYAKRDTASWKTYLSLLVPFNQDWAQHAAVLVIVASHKHFSFNEKDSRTHSFDTGTACQNMALQAYHMGFVCHGMEGFDYDRAHQIAGLDEHYVVQAMFALGVQGPLNTLSEELQKREKPSDRMPLSKIVFEGSVKR